MTGGLTDWGSGSEGVMLAGGGEDADGGGGDGGGGDGGGGDGGDGAVTPALRLARRAATAAEYSASAMVAAWTAAASAASAALAFAIISVTHVVSDGEGCAEVSIAPGGVDGGSERVCVAVRDARSSAFTLHMHGSLPAEHGGKPSLQRQASQVGGSLSQSSTGWPRQPGRGHSG